MPEESQQPERREVKQDRQEKPDDLIGRKAIAKRLRVHVKTVQRWDSTGQLPDADFECGGLRRWRRDTIEAWIRKGGTRAARQILAEEGREGGRKKGQKGAKGSKSPNG